MCIAVKKYFKELAGSSAQVVYCGMAYNKSGAQWDYGRVDAQYREVMRSSPSGTLWRKSQSEGVISQLLIAIQPDRKQTLAMLDILHTHVKQSICLAPFTNNQALTLVLTLDNAAQKTGAMLKTYFNEVGRAIGTNNQRDPVVDIRLPMAHDTTGWSHLCGEAAKMSRLGILSHPLTEDQLLRWVRKTAQGFTGRDKLSYKDFNPERLANIPAVEPKPSPTRTLPTKTEPKGLTGIALGI